MHHSYLIFSGYREFLYFKAHVLMFVFIFDTKVRLDGQDLRFLDQRWFRQQTGIVHKKPEFFNTSIADNIAYGKGDATFKEIVRAAKAAGAHEFITAFPKVSYSRNF